MRVAKQDDRLRRPLQQWTVKSELGAGNIAGDLGSSPRDDLLDAGRGMYDAIEEHGLKKVRKYLVQEAPTGFNNVNDLVTFYEELGWKFI